MRFGLTTRITLGLILGAGFGLLLAAGSPGWTGVATAVCDAIGGLWVNAILMTVIPLVVSLLIVGLGGHSDLGAVSRLGGRAVLLFTMLLLASGFLTAAVGPSIMAAMPLDTDVVNALQASASTLPPETPRLGDLIAGIVPANVVAAAADGAMLPLLVFAVLFAAALTRIDPERRAVAVGFFQAVADASMHLVGWVIAAAPLGVFALTAAMVAVTDRALLGALGYYVGALCLTSVFFTLALYLLPAFSRHLSLRRFASAVAPAQGVAFGSRSSLASLPAMVDGVRRHLALAPEATTFVLPFAASTFKFASPFNSVLGVLFVCRLYGIDLAPGQLPVLVLVAVLLSFAVPGVPGGSFSTLPLFLAAGLPPESIGLLIAVDALPDSFRTVANVTADVAVASVLTPSGAAGRVGAVPSATVAASPASAAGRGAEPPVASVARAGAHAGRSAAPDPEPQRE